MEAAAKRARPIPVFAEMSSLNPVFVLPDALRTRGAEIAKGLLSSVTLGVGQFCTKPGLVFLQRGAAADALLSALGTLTKGAPCGTLLTRGIQRAFVEHRDRVLSVPGVKIGVSSEVLPSSQKTEVQPGFAVTGADVFLKHPEIATEVFGPFTVVVLAETADELLACARALDGQLTATLHTTDSDHGTAEALLEVVAQKSGRIVFNGFPTGVEVSAAMNHGGPWPATSDVRFTSVGTAAILRFARPLCYQNCPPGLLPEILRDKASTP
jgi:NADP-dependent aldehyde dehydrogenase